jgi:O-antigen/teichoic acid export membrane protein
VLVHVLDNAAIRLAIIFSSSSAGSLPARIKRLLSSRGAAIALVVLSSVASVVNYASSLVFSRILTPASFGDLTALLALTVIVAVPTGAAQTVIAARIADLRSKDDVEGIRWYIRHALAHISMIAAVIGLIYAALIPAVVPLLDLQAIGPAIALLPLLCLSFFMPAAFGILQGLERFAALGAVLIIVSLGRIAIGVPWALADSGGSGGPLIGQAVGNAVALAVIGLVLGHQLRLGRGSGAARSGARRRPGRRALQASGAFIAFAILSNLDVLLAKLVLSPEQSGDYAALATLEKVVMFAPGAVAVAMVPAAVRAAATSSAHAQSVLRRCAAVVLGMALVVVIPLSVAPGTTIRLMFGDDYSDAVGGVVPITLAGAGLAVAYLLVVYTVALSDHRLVLLLAGSIVLQVAAIGAFHTSAVTVAEMQAGVVAAVLVANELWGSPVLLRARGRRMGVVEEAR